MRKLFTLTIGRKEYLTTNDAVAWDVCIRFEAELVSTEQTNRRIDGLECQDIPLLDIYKKLKGILSLKFTTVEDMESSQINQLNKQLWKN